ncbi:MAG: glycine--tRNA ligase subunit beta [Bacillota bacterium]
MPADLILEIGVEEFPAKAMPSTLAALAERGRHALNEARLVPGGVRAFGTPRRLTLVAGGVPDRQAPVTVEARGPAVKAAFDAGGQPTKAALGFASGQGVPVSSLERRPTPAGEYLYAVRSDPGRPALDVLAEILPQLIAGLEFPRAMRWGTVDFKFLRPIRWLLCLLGSEVVPCAVAGVASGRETYGHRALHPGRVTVPEAGSYLAQLEGAWVMADQDARRRAIQAQVAALAAEVGGVVPADPELLEEVTQLVEYPTALRGKFDARFLKLPADVLITTMKHHQRYFPVLGGDGQVLPHFITVRNGDATGLETVRRGNEHVLTARLEDAAFFYGEDLKVPLADRVETLAGVTFLEALGTMADKSRRLEQIAAGLARLAAGVLPGLDSALAARAGKLAKADLTTAVVKEFPELQGYMGREYARLSGEAQAVCQAIDEHYRPRGAGAELPGTPLGIVLAVADKLDTVAGCLGVGLNPTGSQDPYGLRRRAAGVVATLLAHDLPLDLKAAVGLVQAAYPEAVREQIAAALPAILDFLRQRTRGLLAEAGHRYDVIEAAMGTAGADDPADARRRCRALERFRAEEGFADLVVGFTRAYNIAGKAGEGPVDPARFTEPAEGALYSALERAGPPLRAALRAFDYDRFFREAAALRGPIDTFFTEVFVMAEAEAVRTNRLALVRDVARLLGAGADLSKLAGDERVAGEGR